MASVIIPGTEHPPTKVHNHELKAAKWIVLGLIPSRGVFEIRFDHQEWCDLLKPGMQQGFCNCDAAITIAPAKMGMVE